MNSELLAGLDGAELQQLGLNAGAAGDGAAALAYFKEAAKRPDATAATHFLLGAEYAQNKLYEHAVGEFEAALALDPALVLARFQLGLLLLTMGDAARSEQVLLALDELPEGDPLLHFGRGLRHMMHDELAQARSSLQAGLALGTSNPALGRNIELIVEALPQAEAPTASEPAAAQPEDDSGWRHMLISAYTGNGTHQD